MNSPFAWPGGKHLLIKRLLPLIPEHTIYIEPFSGSAKLLFAKEASPWEIINDVNADVVTFFRVAKHRPAELAELFEHEIVHAGRFRELRGTAATDACEVQRAFRFLYLNWWSFGAKGEHFAAPTIRSEPRARLATKRSLDVVREILAAAAKRLRDVMIEQRDFAETIERYDSKETFFYLDPPYTSFSPNGRYEALGPERNAELMKRLGKLRGKFLMSFDDCAEVRGLVREHRFQSKPVGVVYSLSTGNRRKHPELLISNYPLPHPK